MSTGILEATVAGYASQYRTDDASITSPSLKKDLQPEISPRVLAQLTANYSGRKLGYILGILNGSELQVIHDDERLEPRDYLILARIKRMSPEKLDSYHYFEAKPEYARDAMDFRLHWILRERNFIRSRLIDQLGKEPSEAEIEDKLADEISDPGKSHSKMGRAHYALRHPDRVVDLHKFPNKISLPAQDNMPAIAGSA